MQYEKHSIVNFFRDFHGNCVLVKILSWGIFLSMCIVEPVGTDFYALCACMSYFYSMKPSSARVVHETYPCALNPSIILHLCTVCSMGLSRCATFYIQCFCLNPIISTDCFPESQISVTATSYCRTVSPFFVFHYFSFPFSCDERDRHILSKCGGTSMK
jgi:hypothetical protein